MIKISKSLIKAIEILDCFKEKEEMSLDELIKKTNMSKTTVFRLLSSLEEGGLISRKKIGRQVTYRLALKFLTYGKHVSERLQYNKIALPYMKRLNKELDELVHLTVIEDNKAVYVETFYSNKPLRLVVKEGASAPLYAGSAPKLLLASMQDKDLDDYLEVIKLKKITDNTITSKEKLKREILKIRKQGYSISYSEHFDDTVGFSYPIYDFNGNIVAALGVSVPKRDYSKEREKLILNKLESTVMNIWKELGFIKKDDNKKEHSIKVD